jgi:hypothetical protein
MKGYENSWRSVVIAGIAAASLSLPVVAQAAETQQPPVNQGMNQQPNQKVSGQKSMAHKKFSAHKHPSKHMARAGAKHRKIYGSMRHSGKQPTQQQLQGTGGARGTSGTSQ